MRTLIAKGVAGVKRLPPCLYCFEKGRKVPAQFDFMAKSGRWTFGCRPHWAKNRKYKEIGTGFAVRLMKQ